MFTPHLRRHRSVSAGAWALLAAAAWLSGCVSAPGSPVPTAADLTPAITQPQPSPTSAPAASPVPTQTPLPSASPSTVSLPRLCSPLPEKSLADLLGLVSNPYHPPAPGSDDPHHGVDLALLIPGTQAAAAGGPVAAALPGRVVGIITDRFPYGNAVLIETTGEPVESAWWLLAEIPTPAPVLSAVTPLTCPAGPDWVFPDPGRRSIYTLYAHLETAPLVQVGESVTCGQQVGIVGSSGNAMNPHLHFETRVGPSGLLISSMAHYDPSASVDEMRAYCLWRISGVFQLVDPLRVLSLQP